MKKLLALFLVFTLLFTLPVSAADFSGDVTARSYCVIDLETGRVLTEENADGVYEPASLTKIMTVLVALELCDDPANTVVTIGDTAMFNEIIADNGVRISLKKGEEITVESLLYATMLPSACDAATALAWYFGNGDTSAFFDKMNARAAEIGMTDSHFENAHGLTDDGHQSSARDMALLAQEALKNEAFRTIVSTYTYTIPANNKSAERKIKSTIQLMNPNGKYYYEGASGVKTGFTYGAGRCLITTATRGEESYLSVVMGSSYANGNAAFPDTIKLLDWAFDTYAPTTAEIGTAPEIPVIHGVEKTVTAAFSSDVTALLASDEAFTVELSPLSEVDAPIVAGETELGTAVISVDGIVLDRIPLVAATSVEELPYPRWAAGFAWFGIHPYLIFALLFFLLLFVAAVLRILYVQSVRRKRRARRRRMAHLRK